MLTPARIAALSANPGDDRPLLGFQVRQLEAPYTRLERRDRLVIKGTGYPGLKSLGQLSGSLYRVASFGKREDRVPESDFISEEFLEDYDGQTLPWARPPGTPAAFETDRILFGNGDNALEVAVASATSPGQPKTEDLRSLFKKRQANRPAPVLLTVIYTGTDHQRLAAVVGTTGDPSPVTGLSADRAARICAAALAEPDRHAAARTAERLLTGLKDQLCPGLVNSGLFASHELRTGVPERPDWEDARKAALPLLGLHGQSLIQALGYQTAPRGSAAMLLTHHAHARAVAVLLDETEVFDRPAARFGAVSPIAHGLTIATQEELPWLIVLRSTQIRLYPANPDVGVGRKGQAETYTELDLALLSEEEAAYLTLLFAPSALVPGGTAAQILDASENFAVGLSERLRERIYGDVVPGLALAVAARMNPQTPGDLTEAYHRALLILFRLLFLAYAEDRGLLPYGRNPWYDRHAIKTLARDFADDSDLVFDMHATSLWDGMLTVWASVDEGNAGWDVPAYNGGLFARDPVTNPSGAALAGLRLTDAEFGPILRALLVDTGEDGTQGPVDFRSLSVREFGTIYEGLLESDLSVSQTDLTVDDNSSYLPAGPGDEIVVPAGEVYIRNQSGQRKATGSYFTKQFAVEHLLGTALEPAIDAHLARVCALLDHGDEAAAADAFFDLRVADLAMGSAHFLVAAIDRIEARFTAFLTEQQISAVSDELARLAQAARSALGEHALSVEIETGALLRRQIARRCIYGIDMNLMAVELARLAIWIHTFVPGLPMSSLDHNLVVGNSLTGVGTLEEVLAVLEPRRDPGQASFYTDELTAALEAARDRLMRAARTAEATKAEVHEAAKAHAKAMDDAADARALLDAAVGVRLGTVPLPAGPEQAIRLGKSARVQDKIEELQAAQLPYLFPEVFLRDPPGFDVLIGNPPWDKLQVEEHSFYSLHFPGLRGLSQEQAEKELTRIRAARPDLVAEYERETEVTQAVKTALARGTYPGLTAGRPDLYKAFAWRMWHLVRRGGYIGVVLPRKALEASGMKAWRCELLTHATFTDVTTLTNTDEWVFDNVHGQYTVGLVTIRADKTASTGRLLPLRGPFHSLAAYQSGITRPGGELRVDDFLGWSNAATLPQLPDDTSLRIFLTIRAYPRLDHDSDGWSVRGLRELNATDDKGDFEFAKTPGAWPVYKGESFERWNPETGTVYAWARPDHIIKVLQARRMNQIRNRRSAFYGMPPAWAADPQTLPALHPRIAWRDVARATDTRTVIAALVPPSTILVHQAYYLFWRQGSPATQAYVLGVLSALPFDWYARQMVESHVTVEFMRSAPVPRVPEENVLRRRVVEIAGRLSAVDDRYAEWAAEVGVPVGSVTDEVTKQDLTAELDAAVALLYGLERADVKHVFATFHRGWDYQPRLASVLAHYDRWAEIQPREEQR